VGILDLVYFFSVCAEISALASYFDGNRFAYDNRAEREDNNFKSNKIIAAGVSKSI
jgi:hypothetical protein